MSENTAGNTETRGLWGRTYRWSIASIFSIAVILALAVPLLIPQARPTIWSANGQTAARGNLDAGEPLLSAEATQVIGLEVPKRHHDFGVVPPGARLSTRFEIVNRGDRELHVSVLNKSCGCTNARCEPVGLRKGSSGLLLVEFDVPAHPGPVTHFVTIGDGGAEDDEATVTFSARAQWAVAAFPSDIFTGVMLREKRVSRDIELTSMTGEPFQVTRVDPSASWIKAVPLDNGGRRQRYQITVAWPGAIGRFDGTVTFYTSSQNRPRIDVHVAGEAADECRVSPARILLGTRSAGSEAIVNFVVQGRAPASENLRANIADGSWGLINLTSVAANQDVSRLTAHITVPSQPGYHRTSLILEPSGNDERFEVPISCLVR